MKGFYIMRMSSIKTRMTLLTVAAVIASLTLATLLGVLAVRNTGVNSSEQILRLLCETGEKNIDAYFVSTEQSVGTVCEFISDDLDKLDDDSLRAHMKRAEEIFRNAAAKTGGVLTYYYRLDPSVSDTVRGFWYINTDEGFVDHEVTDITQYDTGDTSALVWFTVPKATGKAIWLPPYITENLGERVISYNEPVYHDGRFIGVVGIEIDYDTLAALTENIELFESGYAFIADADGDLICHPMLDTAAQAASGAPDLTGGAFKEGEVTRYTYDGTVKEAVALTLENGMRIYVTVPVSEIDGDWTSLIVWMILSSAVLLAVFALITIRFTDRITKPLTELTYAAQLVNEGDYDVVLDYDGSDEVGVLTATISKLVKNLKVYIGDLRNLAFADALTHLRNKGAFDIYARKLDDEINNAEICPDVAVGVFDCDGLKSVNDHCGHEKGDIYLKNASKLICRVFKHSPVFRTGGDEFTVILQNEDFLCHNELAREFAERCDNACKNAKAPWDKISVAMGIAVFDRAKDRNINGVIRRADRLMYENKRSRKALKRMENG